MSKLVRNIIGAVVGLAIFFLGREFLPIGGILGGAIAGGLGGAAWGFISADYNKKDCDNDETNDNDEANKE